MSLLLVTTAKRRANTAISTVKAIRKDGENSW